jgi:hypothetical protein
MTSPFSEITMDAGARAAQMRNATSEGIVTRDSTIVEPVNVLRDPWGRLPGDPDYNKNPQGGGTGGNTGVRVMSDAETATTILQNTLKYYGLDDPELVTSIKNALANRIITGNSTVDEIGVQLRDTPAFQKRFSANEARRAAGKPAYSVSQYLQLESSYRNTLRAAGMPDNFYDTPEDFQRFIANDVSPDEIQYRVQQGYQAVKEADPTVVNELKTLYGLKDSEIAAFFIDPNRARDSVVRAARAAEVAAQARTQAGIGLEAAQAERLVQQGITQREAQVGFQQVQQAQQLLSPVGGEQPLTEQQLIEGVLGTSAEAVQRVATTRRRRRAAFEQGGAAALGQVGQ